MQEQEYLAKMRYFCRQPGSRINCILTLIEKGLDAHSVRIQYNRIARKRGWAEMPSQEEESLYSVGKKILDGTLCKPGEIEHNEETRMKNGCIAWKRAQRVVRVVHLRTAGRTWPEIIDILGSTQSVVQNDYYQFMNGQINGVYGDYETIPWDEWLEKHSANALKGLRINV